MPKNHVLPVADLIAERRLFIGDGYRAKNAELGTDGLPFARAANIDGGFALDGADRFPETELSRVGEKVSTLGDVVFTSKGTVGRFASVRDGTERFVYSPQLSFWRSLDASTIDSRWLYYWMTSPEFRIQYSRVKGQTDMADYVSLRDQRRMVITLPPIEEQRAIASVLGALDDKIELNRRMTRRSRRSRGPSSPRGSSTSTRSAPGPRAASRSAWTPRPPRSSRTPSRTRHSDRSPRAGRCSRSTVWRTS